MSIFPTNCTGIQYLPGACYLEQSVFNQELKKIWQQTWQFVGRDEDLPRPGDYLTCILGEEPIFVIRLPDGSLQAMHNVCLHRGGRLLDGQGNCSLVRCPYHAWSYDLEGQLLSVPQPHLFANLDKSTIQLLKARVATWGGFIFVNPNADGESLMDYLAGFPAYLQQYTQPYHELREIARWSYEQPINWKFIVENYVEDYHFSTVHPQSLKRYDFQGIRVTPTGRHCQMYIPYSKKQLAESYKYELPTESGSYQGYIFPNLMINTARDHVSIYRLEPLNSISTRVEIRIYQTPMQCEVTPLNISALRASFDELTEEDFAVCRLLQAGASSRAYRISHLAEEHELGIAHFHQVLLEYLDLACSPNHF